MSMDLPHTLESVKEGTKEIAETAHVKTDEFHEKYVSKVLPDCGKYGDAAKFAAEMIPGVAEYNAVKDGDWQAFAIAAGIDIASLAAGAVSAGTGYAAVKGSSKVAGGFLKKAGREVAEAGVKKAAKEFAEAGTEKAVKELAEAGAEKAVKEVAEAGTEKAVKELAEAGTEKAVKEAAETGAEKVAKEIDEIPQIVKNRNDGFRREEEVLKELKKKYDENNIISQVFIRNSAGEIVKDTVTGEARKIDFIIIKGKKIIQSLEVTSETASKIKQMEKEYRILEQARKSGGAFIKHPVTGELIEFGEKIETKIVRIK